MGRYAQLVVGPAGSGKARMQAACLGCGIVAAHCAPFASPPTVSSCTRTAKAWAELCMLSTSTQLRSTSSMCLLVTCVSLSLWR